MADQKAELADLWEQAVNEYLNRSKRGSGHKWKSITTPADLDKLVEQHENSFTQFRSSRRKFWDGLMGTMRQLQNLGNVAHAALQLSSFAPSAVILEAVLFLIGSGAAVSEAYDALETLFRRVKDITDRLDEYLQGTIDQKLHKIVVQLLSSLLDVFGEAEVTIRRGRGKEMMRRVVGKENKIQSTFDQLDEWVKTELALITAKTFATAQRIEEKADNERERDLLRRALYAEAVADNEAFGKSIETSRLSRSGDWLLEEQLYQKWHNMEFPVLWILGRPGTGKTYLASRILSHIQQSSGLGGFFYIRESMNTQHTPQVIMKSIAYQITRLHEEYRDRVLKVCRNGDTLLLPETIWENLFINPFSDEAIKPVYIVIDGVDETTPQNQELLVVLAKQLSNLRNSTQKYPAIQLLLLGRPELDYSVSNVWRGEKRRPKILQIQPSLSRSDVERFIKKGVTEDVTLLQKMRPSPAKRLRRDIIKTLSTSSDGMFMLAKLMLTEIKDMNKPELIRESLAKPPQGLDDMFRRVVARLDVLRGFDKKDLNELLMWVACAKRDLFLGELDLVLKLRDLNQNGIVALEDELKTRFGSFFSVMSLDAEIETDEEDDTGAFFVTGSETTLFETVSEESSESGDCSCDNSEDDDAMSDSESDEDEDEIDGDDNDDDEAPSSYFTATVKFGHASVGQHFRTAPMYRGIGMDLNVAQAHITLTCVRFLTDNIPKKNGRPWREPTLFQYSVNHFLDHFGEVNLEDLKSHRSDTFENLSGEVLFLLQDPDSLSQWLNALTDEYKYLCQLFSQSTLSRLQVCYSESGIPSVQNLTLSGHESSEEKPLVEVVLEPFAHYVVEAWLSYGDCEEMFAILFLQGFLSLRDDETRGQWTLPPNRPFAHLAEGISPKAIQEMATLGGLERDSAFHSALARTFAKIRTLEHLRSAVVEFDNAIALTTDLKALSIARLEKAAVLSALGKHEDVIVTASSALESLPECFYSEKQQLFWLIREASLHLDDQEAAFKAALEAWKSAPDDNRVCFDLIFTAHRTKNYSETRKIIKTALDSTNRARFLGSLLTGYIPQRYTNEYISIAFSEAGDLDLAKAAFEAIKFIGDFDHDMEVMAAADAGLAQLFFGFYRDENKAIALWEDIVQDYPNTVAAFDAAYALISLYFVKAQDTDPAESFTWVSHMERLVDLLDEMRPDSEVHPTQYEATALLGRWYADHGDMERARVKILPMIKQGIQELTDRDNSNDYDGYSHLFRALLCFGDRKNATIATACTKPIRRVQKLTDEGLALDAGYDITSCPAVKPDTLMSLPIGLLGRCDGGCDYRDTTWKTLSLCEICVDMGFCDRCLQQLKDGTLKLRTCNPKHPFIEVYPPKTQITQDAEGYKVHLDEGKAVHLDEWVDMISREWLETR